MGVLFLVSNLFGGFKEGYIRVVVMDLLLNIGGMRFLSINGKILYSLGGVNKGNIYYVPEAGSHRFKEKRRWKAEEEIESLEMIE